MQKNTLLTDLGRCRAWCVSLMFAALVLGPVACSSEPPLPPLHPVKGKVTFDGNPVNAGHVTLHPIQAEENPRLMAGEIKNGEFQIHTGGKSGAPLGKYKVTITPPMVPSEQGTAVPNFNEKYRDSMQTPIEFEVIATPDASRYDLKLKK